MNSCRPVNSDVGRLYLANQTMNLGIVIGCLVIGSAMEALAYWQRLWVYDRSWKRLITMLIVYGLVFGSLSTALVNQSAALRFAAGAFVGVVYEALNVALLRVFSFPNQRLLFLKGPVALSFGAGVCWGLLPLMAPLFRSS